MLRVVHTDLRPLTNKRIFLLKNATIGRIALTRYMDNVYIFFSELLMVAKVISSGENTNIFGGYFSELNLPFFGTKVVIIIY